MNPKYRFFIQMNEGEPVPVHPIYKDDVSLDYDMESSEHFYRAKLSGKLTFVRDDFALIYSAPFDTVFYIHIEKSDDFGRTFAPYYTGKFMLTDCTVTVSDEKITTQLDISDNYTNVLAGIENEYDLIPLAPEIDPLLIQKRPLIQVYSPGDSVVSCFISGMSWEQDVTEPETNEVTLQNKYHFALNTVLMEMNVTGTGPQDAQGLYVGSMDDGSTRDVYSGQLNTSNRAYYIQVSNRQGMTSGDGGDLLMWMFTCQLRRSSDGAILYSYSVISATQFKGTTFTMKSESDSTTMSVDMKIYPLFARYITDASEILGQQTYELPSDDIVADNRNYRRVIRYGISIAYISNNYSSTPTEYGRADNGMYFTTPYSVYNQKFYPIARSTWRYASLWFGFYLADARFEEAGRKTYVLRDAYPVASVIQTLLNQFAPDITHKGTPEYSEFLYGAKNPISGETFRLYVTQKSNILRGEYTQPAQKAPTTLKEFTNMLKNVFQCYWFIDAEKRFRIEHVSWFKNGGTYSGTPSVGYDLTTLVNIRNGKPWAFAATEYTFDKGDMPERYEFGWMDDVTEAFEGKAIEVLSPYVQAGKIEEVNVANFTSDIDLMLLNPSEMSNDGFALFAAVLGNALASDDSGLIPGFGGSSGKDGYTTPTYPVRPEFWGQKGQLSISPTGGTGRVVFYKGDEVISTQGSFSGTGVLQDVTVTIPEGATAMAFLATGSLTVYTYGLRVESLLELPYVTMTIENVEYTMQNGFLAMFYLQPTFWLYDMPASRLRVNGVATAAKGISRKKKQTISFPVGNTDPDTLQLIKTLVGRGEIDKISINLCSRMGKATLRYGTE